MAEQKRNTRNTKSTKVQPVNDYGRIQPQAPELEEAVCFTGLIGGFCIAVQGNAF